jgi:hypothetical protein
MQWPVRLLRRSDSTASQRLNAILSLAAVRDRCTRSPPPNSVEFRDPKGAYKPVTAGRRSIQSDGGHCDLMHLLSSTLKMLNVVSELEMTLC